jgi:hypothetical protein
MGERLQLETLHCRSLPEVVAKATRECMERTIMTVMSPSALTLTEVAQILLKSDRSPTKDLAAKSPARVVIGESSTMSPVKGWRRRMAPPSPSCSRRTSLSTESRTRWSWKSGSRARGEASGDVEEADVPVELGDEG